MKRIRKITRGISVAIMIVISVIPILMIASFLKDTKRDEFLDIISEWVADLMDGLESDR